MPAVCQDMERQRMQAIQWGRHLVQPIPQMQFLPPKSAAAKAYAAREESARSATPSEETWSRVPPPGSDHPSARVLLRNAVLGEAWSIVILMLRIWTATLLTWTCAMELQTIDMFRAMQMPEGGNETNREGGVMGFSNQFSAFDYGVATSQPALEELEKVGDFVGIQVTDPTVNAVVVLSYPYYWYSLTGACPNLPWTCLRGSNYPSCPTTSEDVGVNPVPCESVGCEGKSAPLADSCKADFSRLEQINSGISPFAGVFVFGGSHILGESTHATLRRVVDIISKEQTLTKCCLQYGDQLPKKLGKAGGAAFVKFHNGKEGRRGLRAAFRLWPCPPNRVHKCPLACGSLHVRPEDALSHADDTAVPEGGEGLQLLVPDLPGEDQAGKLLLGCY
eukprot:s772_g4.t1